MRVAIRAVNRFLMFLSICFLLLAAAGCFAKKSEHVEQLSPFVAGTLQQSAPAVSTPVSPEPSVEVTASEAAEFSLPTSPALGTETLAPTQALSVPSAAAVISTASPSSTPNPYPLPGLTPTLTPTRTPTRTAASPTVQPGWQGEWVGYLQQSDGTQVSGNLVVSLQGTELKATLKVGNQTTQYEGITFNQGVFATGMMVGGGNKDSFWWSLLPNGQFRGCFQNKLAFCGSRLGVSQPDPCLEIPTS